MNRIDTLGSSHARAHAYDVEVNAMGDYLRIYASNRAQAANIAKRAGYEVRSVNMVG